VPREEPTLEEEMPEDDADERNDLFFLRTPKYELVRVDLPEDERGHAKLTLRVRRRRRQQAPPAPEDIAEEAAISEGATQRQRLDDGVSSEGQMSLPSSITVSEESDDEDRQLERETNPSLLDSFIVGAPLPAEQPGMADGAFEEPVLDGRHRTLLKMDSLVHWSTGDLLTQGRKEVLLKIAQNPLYRNIPPMSRISVDTAIDVLCSSGFPEAMGIDRADLACLVTAADAEWDLPTPGCWFYVDLHDYSYKRPEPKLFYESCAPSEATLAYHGTSLSSACLILADGFRQGPNVTGGKVGVYFEGTARRLCTLNYAVHEHVCVPGTYPLLQFCCILECLVDRSRGRTIHRQWCQPLGSFVVDGIYLHCFDLMSLLAKPNHFGWYRCHRQSLQHLIETKNKDQIKTTWELQQQEYQRVKKKKMRQEELEDDRYQ
jgi:hypothetical protein